MYSDDQTVALRLWSLVMLVLIRL